MAYSDTVNSYLNMWKDPSNYNSGKTGNSEFSPCDENGDAWKSLQKLTNEANGLASKWGRGFTGWRPPAKYDRSKKGPSS